MVKTRQQIIHYAVVVTTPLEWTDAQNEAAIENYSDLLESLLKNTIKAINIDSDIQIEVTEE